MIYLKCSLILIGGFLGPMNLGLFFAIGSKINPIPFYDKMSFLLSFKLFGGFWFFLMLAPCLMGTCLALALLWRPLLTAQTKRHHVIWGMKFGGTATISSTIFLIISGALFNYMKGFSTVSETFLGLGFALPGGLVLGAGFIILFAPAILISGPLYGLLAQILKRTFLEKQAKRFR